MCWFIRCKAKVPSPRPVKSKQDTKSNSFTRICLWAFLSFRLSFIIHVRQKWSSVTSSSSTQLKCFSGSGWSSIYTASFCLLNDSSTVNVFSSVNRLCSVGKNHFLGNFLSADFQQKLLRVNKIARKSFWKKSVVRSRL